jgi:hypothetical protein
LVFAVHLLTFGERRKADFIRTSIFRPVPGELKTVEVLPYLGVSSPALSMAISERIAKPGAGLWPIQVRVGSIMPEKRDVWWDIDRQTDIALLGVEISKILVSYAVPLLECYGTARVFDDHLLSRYDGPSIGIFPGPLALARATLAVQLGNKDRAASLLRAQLEETEIEGYADVVRRLAKELDVSLEPAAKL